MHRSKRLFVAWLVGLGAGIVGLMVLQSLAMPVYFLIPGTLSGALGVAAALRRLRPLTTVLINAGLSLAALCATSSLLPGFDFGWVFAIVVPGAVLGASAAAAVSGFRVRGRDP